MLFLFLILFVLYIFVTYLPLHNAHATMTRDAADRNALLLDKDFRESVRRRRYAPLHTLPNLKWHNTLDTIEGSSSCFSLPTLVTLENVGTFDCTAVCNDDRALYFYVHPHDKYVVNGSMLMSGGYCTMNSVPRNCNGETSLVLHSVNQWTCIAEDPRYFAGEGNLEQVAGRQHIDQVLSEEVDKIVLWDRKLNRRVNPVMNTFRSDWDELMDDGERRFEVRCDALDVRHNLMFVNPLNEIECLPNVCTSVQWVHRDVRPAFDTGVCDCGDISTTRVQHIDEGDLGSRCASIVNRLNRDDREYYFRVDCLSMDTPITEYGEDKLMCPPEVFNQNTDYAYTFRMRGVIPLSGNGIDEPTTRLWRDTRSRVVWNNVR
ncbi:pif-2 [Clostera anastomosis granulovirus A]|uniref:Pif-2 n=1 Tax=Clostera anastomosis granulovirus A TaxID=1986289 RepID=U5KBK3_9BBAC|nr:pif-2 [Clostera anastomosis granulovirus Henan]AGQ20283.1 pif-2 [Clostera anastomosis granulovirus Henan]